MASNGTELAVAFATPVLPVVHLTSAFSFILTILKSEKNVTRVKDTEHW